MSNYLFFVCLLHCKFSLDSRILVTRFPLYHCISHSAKLFRITSLDTTNNGYVWLNAAGTVDLVNVLLLVEFFHRLLIFNYYITNSLESKSLTHWNLLFPKSLVTILKYNAFTTYWIYELNLFTCVYSSENLTY